MKRLPLALLCSAAAYIVAMFYVSVMPIEEPEPYFFDYQDKVMHFGAYAVLGLLLAGVSATGGRGYLYAGGVLAGLFVGVMSEFLQVYVRTRTASFFDGLANVLGLLLVIAVYEAIHLWRKGGVIYVETLPPAAEEKKEKK
jgi:VanZ family protein